VLNCRLLVLYLFFQLLLPLVVFSLFGYLVCLVSLLVILLLVSFVSLFFSIFLRLLASGEQYSSFSQSFGGKWGVGRVEGFEMCA